MARTAMNLVGATFGRLAVTKFHSKQGRRYMWACTCTCGAACVAATQDLRRGDTRSCGCLHREAARTRATTHGMSSSPEFVVWGGMLQRCNPGSSCAPGNYVNKSIRVCPSWTDFARFYHDMGPRPTQVHTLERIDNAAGYSKANCKWATRAEQANNTCRTRRLTFGGCTQSMSLWAAELGISYTGLRARLRRGWSAHAALNTPFKAAL